MGKKLSILMNSNLLMVTHKLGERTPIGLLLLKSIANSTVEIRLELQRNVFACEMFDLSNLSDYIIVVFKRQSELMIFYHVLMLFTILPDQIVTLEVAL